MTIKDRFEDCLHIIELTIAKLKRRNASDDDNILRTLELFIYEQELIDLKEENENRNCDTCLHDGSCFITVLKCKGHIPISGVVEE